MNINFRRDLKECSQIFIKSVDNREYSINRINPYQYNLEIENPHVEYTQKSLDATLHLLPAYEDVVQYIVHRPNELTEEQTRFINGLRPKMCSPFFRKFVLQAGEETLEASKTPEGRWVLHGQVCDMSAVIAEVKSVLLRHIVFTCEMDTATVHR